MIIIITCIAVQKYEYEYIFNNLIAKQRISDKLIIYSKKRIVVELPGYLA